MWCPCLAPLAASFAGLLETQAPGSRPLSRRQMLQGMMATISLAAAGCASTSPANREAFEAMPGDSISVDLHSHPGLTPLARLSTREHVERMTSGRLRASLFSAVADRPLLALTLDLGIYATREPRPGELYASTYEDLRPVQDLIATGRLVHVKSPSDLEAARAQGKPGAILATEGGDFLEGRLGRVEEAYQRGVRSIQLVHYRVNELGDIQTGPPVHGGLTPFGRDVIREMNRLGMVVDLAHATFEGVEAAVEVSSRPVLLSHTLLGSPETFRRAVTREHARLVAQGGGVVGVFPVAIGGAGLSTYLDHVARMVEAIGVNHVGIGTDLDGIPGGRATFDNYGEWPSIRAGLLARGFSQQDVAKVMGGNFVRVFGAVVAGTQPG